MYGSKSKNCNSAPSDAQAKEKLIIYVYEYLLHAGASKTADSFLREIHFDKPITLGDSPGFLLSWWGVFWDLYSSAPERRNLNPHSDEAKAFHDYGFVNGHQNNGQLFMNGMQHNSNAPSPLGQMPPNDGMPGGPLPPAGFFPNSHMRPSPTQQPVNQPSPHSQMIQNQAFLSPRYPGGPGPRPNVRMPTQVDFNPPPTGVPGQSMMPGNMDPNRQGDGGDFVGWQGPPPSMQPLNPRMSVPHPQQPRVPPMNQMGNMGQFPPMRPPNGPNGPPVNGQGGQPNGQQMPINMPVPNGPPGGPGRQWANNNMNYNSSSPGNHYGPPVSNSGPGPAPGTPGAIMPSPQGSAGPYSPASHRMGTPNTGRDSSGPGGDGMYPMMKQVPIVNIPNFTINEPSIQAPPTSSPLPTDPILESIKQSPGNTLDQSNQEHNNLDYNNIVPYQENDQNESAAILKIKESMQEEAKRFEKDPPGEHTEYYMQ